MPHRASESTHSDPLAVNADQIWTAIRAARHISSRDQPPTGAVAYALDARGALQPVSPDHPHALLIRDARGWHPTRAAVPAERDLLDLYLPICGKRPQEPLTIGHLGQSLDGSIATASGDSCFVTGHENFLHLHRMRALCDAILVGAETVAKDDPRLTTRLVPGDNPVRVVLDPRHRLGPSHRLFNDGAAPTLVIRIAGRGVAGACPPGEAEVLELAPDANGALDLAAALRALHERNLQRVFVEGGGVTVSAFLEAHLLDRLQLAIAPVLIGNGRRGIQVPSNASMQDCMRPRCRVFRMGADILFDCEPRDDTAAQNGDQAPAGVTRVS